MYTCTPIPKEKKYNLRQIKNKIRTIFRARFLTFSSISLVISLPFIALSSVHHYDFTQKWPSYGCQIGLWLGTNSPPKWPSYGHLSFTRKNSFTVILKDHTFLDLWNCNTFLDFLSTYPLENDLRTWEYLKTRNFNWNRKMSDFSIQGRDEKFRFTKIMKFDQKFQWEPLKDKLKNSPRSSTYK